MATAIEYGIIAAGISLAIIAVVNVLPESNPQWDGSLDRKNAAEACIARPTNTTTDTVVIKNWLQRDVVYKCSSWPKIFSPTYVRHL